MCPIAGRPSREIGGHFRGKSDPRQPQTAIPIYMETRRPPSCLARRPGGSLLIEDPGAVERIQVTVPGIKGNQVRMW